MRNSKSAFFPEHIREAPVDLPPTTTSCNPPPAQVSNPQVLAGDVGIPIRVVGKGKEVLPSAKDIPAEDSLSIKDVVSKAKAAKSKSDVGDAKHKATDLEKGSQPTKK